ncbi:unnamed protein product [Toxocara canis]|uniref:Uncharacterized protein n=1 Tax=Toxocara canis TaxID=6265 RepID=A0A183UVT7_TOXCA|nr:unnamed protein product [Toxocara canis]
MATHISRVALNSVTAFVERVAVPHFGSKTGGPAAGIVVRTSLRFDAGIVAVCAFESDVSSGGGLGSVPLKDWRSMMLSLQMTALMNMPKSPHEWENYGEASSRCLTSDGTLTGYIKGVHTCFFLLDKNSETTLYAGPLMFNRIDQLHQTSEREEYSGAEATAQLRPSMASTVLHASVEGEPDLLRAAAANTRFSDLRDFGAESTYTEQSNRLF